MASSRLNCAMLRLGHPGSLSYSCEQSRAARRRFAQKHGSTDTSAISILHHHFDGQFMVHSMARGNGTYVLEHRLKRGYRSLGEGSDALSSRLPRRAERQTLG